MIQAPTVPDRYRPLLALIDSQLLLSSELAARWRYTEQTLSNARNAGKGLPYILTPTGGVRYRASEIVAAELAGTRGPLSVERVALELATMPDVSPELAKAITSRLSDVLRGAG